MAGLVAVGGGLLMVLFIHGPHARFWPPCLFHKFSGLHCPVCGMTRAVAACLHGEIGQAFRYNPVMMVVLPLAGLMVAIELAGWVRGRPFGLRLLAGRRAGLALLVVVVAFWVLRNLPVWPCTLLAPP